jgi:hypothetical protein
MKSLANFLNCIQQLTVCYIAYNLAHRTQYLLQVEQNLQTEGGEENEPESDEPSKLLMEEYGLQEKTE